MNVSRVLEAVSFATLAHHGQVRKFENEPYVNHCIRVARSVAFHDGDENTIVAALLHDVLEDCPQITTADIRLEFGEDVTTMVELLTHPPLSVGNRATRKRLEAETLHRADGRAQTIKLADCIDNIPSIVEHDKTFAPRFIEEKNFLIPGLTKGNGALFSDAMRLLDWARAKLLLDRPITI